MENGYFAAANTTKGFVSYYNETFRECERIYVIKGGSGTGKSRFMRDCAEFVKHNGKCESLEYFYCSFDPHSLDGIIINGKTAIIDGTAPHVYEPTMAGAREDILDLGRFWDSDRLFSKKDELSRLFAIKRSHFAKGYKYLGSYGELDSIRQMILESYADRERIKADAAKLVSEIDAKEGNVKLRLISAVGREGRVRLDTYEKSADRVVEVPDKYGEAHIFLSAVKEEAERFSLPIVVSYDPLFAGRVNALLVGGTAFVASSGIADEKYMKNGFSAEAEKIEHLRTMQDSLLDEAIGEFCLAAKVHFGIEEIYVGSMDFKRKEAFTREFLEKLKI